MEKDTNVVKANEAANEGEVVKIDTGKEIDADNKVHETSPDLIQKESHRLPVDDEVKKG